MYLPKSQNGLGSFFLPGDRYTGFIQPKLPGTTLPMIATPTPLTVVPPIPVPEPGGAITEPLVKTTLVQDKSLDLSDAEQVAKIAAGWSKVYSPASVSKMTYAQATSATRWALSNWGLSSPHFQTFEANMDKYVWPQLESAGLVPKKDMTPTTTISDAAGSVELPDISISQSDVVGDMPTFVDVATGQTSPLLKYGLLALGAYILYDSFIKTKKKGGFSGVRL